MALVEEAAIAGEELAGVEGAGADGGEELLLRIDGGRRGFAAIVAGDEDTAHRLLKFADVARPGVGVANGAGECGADKSGQFAPLRAEHPAQDAPHQNRQFARLFAQTLAQRRHDNDVGAEAIVEVVAKLSGLAHGIEGLVGGGDDAAVEALAVMAADRIEGALLQNLQQLDLHRDGEVADLVEKDRTVRGAAGKGAGMVADGAGESPLLMAEELRFDQ